MHHHDDRMRHVAATRSNLCLIPDLLAAAALGTHTTVRPTRLPPYGQAAGRCRRARRWWTPHSGVPPPCWSSRFPVKCCPRHMLVVWSIACISPAAELACQLAVPRRLEPAGLDCNRCLQQAWSEAPGPCQPSNHCNSRLSWTIEGPHLIFKHRHTCRATCCCCCCCKSGTPSDPATPLPCSTTANSSSDSRSRCES